MATTWEVLLANIRLDLQDSGTNKKWSDATIYLYTVDAVRDYSIWFPYRVDRYELTLSGSSYPLPADFVDDIYLEVPENRFLEKREDIPGRKYLDTYRPTYYYIDGGNLYLNGSPLSGESVLLTYQALHDVPTDETDTSFSFTIPDADIEMIRLYVRAQIYENVRTKASRLDQYKPGSGRRDDNPLAKETNLLLDSYYEKLARRIGGGAIKLFRPGKVR